MKNEFQTVQNKQQNVISRDINILRSNLSATTNILADVKENLRNQNEEFQEQLKSLTNEVNNLRANFTGTMNHVEKRSMTHFTSLSSRVDAESVLRKVRSSNSILVLPPKILEFIF